MYHIFLDSSCIRVYNQYSFIAKLDVSDLNFVPLSACGSGQRSFTHDYEMIVASDTIFDDYDYYSSWTIANQTINLAYAKAIRIEASNVLRLKSRGV